MNDEQLIEKLEQEEITLASFQKRGMAHIIDEILISFLFLFTFMDQIPQNATEEEVLNVINHLIFYIVVLKVIYQTFFVWMYGATLGKIAMKIKVVSINDLEKPTLFFALNRAVFRVLGEMLFYIGFVWAFSNPKRATWHDMIAKTLVINAQ